jgi:itaconate CoA-transferase
LRISLKEELMAYEDQYKAKLTDSHGAVAQIGSNSTVAIGQAVCQPPALMEALAVRAEAGSVDNVKVYYMHAEENMKRSLLRYELMGRIKPYCMFMQEAERELIKRAQEDGDRKVVYYVPNSFSQSIRFFTEHIHVDTFLVTVSPMDRNGYFTFGTNNDYTSSAAREAKRLIVEVNRHMPRVLGRSSLHISEVDAIVENDAPLLTLTPRPIQDQERKLGQRIAELIPEYACLQIGVGGVPSGVCEALMDRKDLGIHTEVLNPALAQLIQSGVVTNRWKRINPGKSVFTFAMGDEAFYEFLHDNIAIESHPVNYVNDPVVIAQNDNVVSVNSTIEMDLTGACNSEYVRGHQFTSTGGQLDFVRGAYASKGGMSFIAFESAIKDGKISKIVPRLSGPVTTPRTDIHYVVTENGVANLKGLSSTERAQALIALAHPAFRDELTAAAKEMHLL